MPSEVVVVEDAPRYAGSSTIVRASEIDALAPESVADVLRRVPGLHVAAEDGAGLFVNVGVRGLAPARSTKVLVLEDGVPIAPGPYGHPELYWSPPVGRIDRVEVVRGSASIRFGPQTIGGVINYLSPPVPDRPLAEVEARAGSFGLGVVRATGGNGGAADGWRIDAEHRQFGGPRGIDLVATDVAAKAAWERDQQRASVRLSWADQVASPSYLGLTTDQLADDPRLNLTDDDRFELTRLAGHGELRSTVGARGELRSSAYAQQVIRSWARQAWERSEDGAEIVLLDANTQRDRLYAFGGIEEELRVRPVLTGDDDLALRTGVRLHTEYERQLQLAGASAAASGGALTAEDVLTGNAAAAWTEAEVNAGDSVHITLGLRGEAFWSRRETRFPEETDAGRFQGELLPGFGASWRVAGPLTLWAGMHRGWAPPSTTDAITSEGTVLALQAERSWNAELGARLLDLEGASVEVTAFCLRFENQVVAPSEAGVASVADLVNGDPTRHLGTEVDARWDLGTPLRTGWSLEPWVRYSFVDARYTGGPFAGNVLPYAPRHLGNAGLRVSAPDALAVQVWATHVGPHFADGANTVQPTADGTNGRLEGWTTLDATASLTVRVARGHSARVDLAGRNLTNEIYVASRAPAGIQPAGFRGWELAVGGEW